MELFRAIQNCKWQSLLHTATGYSNPANRINVSGRVTAIEVGGSDTVVYLGAAGAGVWKGINMGVGFTWDPLTDNLPATGVPVAGNAIGAIAVVGNANPALDIVYVGPVNFLDPGDLEPVHIQIAGWRN
jgi:hypothetical protein